MTVKQSRQYLKTLKAVFATLKLCYFLNQLLKSLYFVSLTQKVVLSRFFKTLHYDQKQKPEKTFPERLLGLLKHITLSFLSSLSFATSEMQYLIILACFFGFVLKSQTFIFVPCLSSNYFLFTNNIKLFSLTSSSFKAFRFKS